MSDFKKCPNGHYYQGAFCPYCKTAGGANTTSSTIIDPISGGSGTGPTVGGRTGTGETSTNVGSGPGSGQKTTVVGGYGETIVNNGPSSGGGGHNFSNRTVFADEEIKETPEGTVKEQKTRNTRKLVGWIVTYSLDAMGVDFKIYEGRNIIGRDMDCNITVNDGLVSGKHAVLLFRSGKYSITDQQSSHGTFVNGEDIELEPRYLKDGDIIQMGNTIFMIRFALFEMGV